MHVLARAYRGAHVESFHTGSIAVVDSLGRLLAFAGDPALRTCIRSAAKPFQAIPLIEYGGVDEFDLSGEEIALTCASHGGEPVHVSTAAALLRKGEFDEEDLLCGAHLPYDEKAAEGFYAIGIAPEMAATLTERLKVADDTAVAIALKIHDGSMTRARNPVILRTLELLGVELELPWDSQVRNVVGTVVGEVKADFELEFL